MKSRKEVAEKASQLIEEFSQAYSPRDPRMDAAIKKVQDQLAARQVAPQTIIGKFMHARYQVILVQKLHVSQEEADILKQMEKLARTRTLLPFKRYDPW